MQLSAAILARRQGRILRAQNELFDVAIIGGGIHGASLCRQASRCGFSAIVLEADDYAAGISSKSSKLLHGGLRYLEQGDFGLVREALHERVYQRLQAPHLTRPLPFLFPIISGRTRPAWQVKIGLTGYDALAQLLKPKATKLRSSEFQLHSRVAETEAVWSQLHGLGLKFSALFRYFDAQMDDTRIAVENIVDAVEHGALALNKAPVTAIKKIPGKKISGAVEGDSWEIGFEDRITGDTCQTRAKFLVNLAGPAVPQVHALLSPWLDSWPTPLFSRGTHLVFEGQICDEGLVLPSAERGRFYFALPHFTAAGDATLVGPTSVTVPNNEGGTRPSPQEVEELLGYVRRDFPQAQFSESTLLHAFAGMRILAGASADERSQSVVAVSREDYVVRLPRYRGLLGGKYTTARKTSARILEEVARELGRTDMLPLDDIAVTALPGGSNWNELRAKAVWKDAPPQFQVHSDDLAAAIERFGARTPQLFKLDLEAAGAVGAELTPKDELLLRQALYCIEFEDAVDLDGIYTRLGLDEFPQIAAAARPIIAKCFG